MIKRIASPIPPLTFLILSAQHALNNVPLYLTLTFTTRVLLFYYSPAQRNATLILYWNLILECLFPMDGFE